MQIDVSFIKERIERLKRLQYELECRDDMLFTNLNGNLPRYKQWGNEINILQNQLRMLNQ